jgi:hypothetical protein
VAWAWLSPQRFGGDASTRPLWAYLATTRTEGTIMPNLDELNELIDAMQAVIRLADELPDIDLDALNEQIDTMRAVIELHEQLPA